MTTREQIIAVANEVGLQPYYDAQEVAIERFYAIAFEAGRVAEREECALICDSHADDPVYCGDAIRARSLK